MYLFLKKCLSNFCKIPTFLLTVPNKVYNNVYKYFENICNLNEINGFNINTKSDILLNSSVDLINNYPFNTQKIPIDFNLETKINIEDFKQDLKIYLNNFYTFTDILYQIKFFNDEFHKGRSIKNIADYLLEDNQLFVKHAKFLLDLIEKFILLCKFKAINISKFRDLNVKKEFNKFYIDFREDEMYFILIFINQAKSIMKNF